MEFGPIWRSLKHNKVGYVLIALQIAVTMAIMVNAIVIIQDNARDMARPSGVDEANIFTFASLAFVPETDLASIIDEDLDILRSTPGVVDAVATNSFPLRGGGWSQGVALEPGAGQDTVGTAIYFVDDHGIDAFGLDLVEGRNFLPEQIDLDGFDDGTWPPLAIATQALAEELFPDDTGSIVGKTIYINENDPVTIVGIIERMQAPWNGWDSVENSMLIPMRRESEMTRYVVRTEPGLRDSLMPAIEERLASHNKQRIIRQVETMDDVRVRSYTGDAAMVKMLGFIVILLTTITGLGIVGLTSFNVSRRTRQVGIRRALGASRPAILRYFMTENFLITTVGVIVGGAFAVALNIAMVEAFSLQPLAWYVVPVAMLVLWIVGQLAVAGPAARAARISPATATRSV